MATPLTDIVAEVRDALIETTASFWSADELLAIMHHGIRDLWGTILDSHGEHYLLVDETHVRAVAGDAELQGVPVGCFRVQLLEARESPSDGGLQVRFVPRKYNSPEFAAARAAGDQSSPGVIYYAVSGIGAPVEPPIIRIAPTLSTNLDLRLAYNGVLEIGEFNPIPGDADHALKAWTLAYAMAKESETRTPDAGWLSIYATEKQSILVRIVPRQEQEPEYVEAMFEGV
jgi:hypothetical protein